MIIFASDNGSQFTFSSDQINMENAANKADGGFNKDSLNYWHQPNAPLRATKWTIYEGGVRTPLIANWPGTIPSNCVNESIFALNDLMATIAGIVNFPLPTAAGKDSQDQSLVLLANVQGKRQFVVVQSSGNQYGLRWENWKYIQPANNEEAALYDLQNDIAETTNLLKQERKIAAFMEKRLQEILQSEFSRE